MGTVEATRGGEPSVLFLLGEPGLGKTTLLGRARSLAAGLAIGWAEGVAAETALPFGLLSQALGRLEVFGELYTPTDLGSGQARVSVYHRCTLALQDLCAAAPFLLLVDDLHWADPDSLGLLGFLLRRLRDRPLGLIATMRPWPSEATVLAQDLETTGQASIERLAPLGSSAAEQVAMRPAGGRLSPVELEQVVESCRGNPLLLEQAAAATAAGAPSLPQTCSPAQQLVARFAGLPPSVLAVARAASVVGTRFSPRLAGAVAEVDETAASFALGALIRAGLATSHPDGLVEFAHPLFRQALYDTIEQPERSRLHALALRALLAQGADPAQAAAHAMAGQLVGDALAIEALETAGRTALAGGALESALRLLSSAEGLAGHQAGPQLLLDLAEAELAAVRLGHVKETCARLLNRSPGPADRRRAGHAGQGLGNSGSRTDRPVLPRSGGGRRRYRPVSRRTGPGGDDVERKSGAGWRVDLVRAPSGI
jgi:AAA ATPase domain